MLLEKLLWGIEISLFLGGLSSGLDLRWGHHRGAMTEGITNIGEHTGDFIIAKMLKGDHRHSTRIVRAFHLYGAGHAVENQLGEAFAAAGYPL